MEKFKKLVKKVRDTIVEHPTEVALVGVYMGCAVTLGLIIRSVMKGPSPELLRHYNELMDDLKDVRVMIKMSPEAYEVFLKDPSSLCNVLPDGKHYTLVPEEVCKNVLDIAQDI